jgi:hypothetical protein
MASATQPATALSWEASTVDSDATSLETSLGIDVKVSDPDRAWGYEYDCCSMLLHRISI